MTNYIEQKLTSTTSTYKVPNKKECEEQVICLTIRLFKQKWYQDTTYLKKKIKYYIDIYEKIYM